MTGIASGNPTNGIEQMDTTDGKEAVAHTVDYQKLIDSGLNKEIADELDKLFVTGKLLYADLDERALEALKEFPLEGAQSVLKQFSDSNLEHVTNKSAYLCGVMKTFRQREKLKEQGQGSATGGPDEGKLKEILERTGYSLDVTTGQRKYGGPPPDWGDKPQPGAGCEVFCGKVPKDLFEDSLIPLFENCGKIWDLRLMMDPLTGQNRGYAFVTFCTRDGASESVKQLDNYEIKKGRMLKVNVSVANQRLFVGNIPKSRSKEEIRDEFSKITNGIIDVIVYSAPDDKKRNRGFCFLEYESHKSASLAKRRLGNGRTRVWNCDIIVDWADPQEEPDDDTMSKVKVLYVRNLTVDATEEKLREVFEKYGKIDRVKKIKDYGFIHFDERDGAMNAMAGFNGPNATEKTDWEVSLAKPPTDKKKKEQRMRDQERRMMMMVSRGGGSGGGYYDDYNQTGMNQGPMGGRNRYRGPPRSQGYDDYSMEDYSYGGYGGYDYGRGGGGYVDPYEYDYYGGQSGWDGYEDYSYNNYNYGPPQPSPQPSSRGRGGRPIDSRVTSSRGSRGGGSTMVGQRGRGSTAPRSRGGMRGTSPRGGGGGMRGGRGGNMGGVGVGANSRGRGSKRKLDGQLPAAGGDSKRRPNQQWGSQPIAQQPLTSSAAGHGAGGYGGGHGGGGDAMWYQDSYNQQWG